MADSELLKRVFPERVIRRVEKELGLESPEEKRENGQDSPTLRVSE